MEKMEKKLSYAKGDPDWVVFPLEVADIPDASISELLIEPSNVRLRTCING